MNHSIYNYRSYLNQRLIEQENQHIEPTIPDDAINIIKGTTILLLCNESTYLSLALPIQQWLKTLGARITNSQYQIETGILF